MTQEELNYIKDSFSQILDDIGGNPDWYEVAKAVASDLGTIEKQLEERVTKFPSNLDEAAEEYGRNTFINECMDNGVCDDHDLSDAFKAGAEWMVGQGYTFETIMQEDDVDELVPTCPDMYNHGYSYSDKVIVQIRKKH